MKLFFPFCILLLLHQWNPSEAMIREGNFCIYYESADSLHAKTALSFLQRLQEEMGLDFRITIHDTFHVIIAPSRSFFQQTIKGYLPKWTQGIALTDAKTMIVKSPRWARPEENFKRTLAHELLHLLLAERTNNGKVPRWLDEGLAIFYSDPYRWETSTALSKAIFTGSLIPLMNIDRVLTFERHRAELAYQQSYSAVKYLLSTYDTEALNVILDGIRSGKTLDASFMEAIGSDFQTFEFEWRRYIEKTQKWFWLSDFDYIWVIILLLVLVIGLFIRIRNRKKISSWEHEDWLEDVNLSKEEQQIDLEAASQPTSLKISPEEDNP